jgi:hypothetical protein
MTIRKEFRSPRSASDVWALLRDFGSVHELAKGFVTKTTLEQGGKARVVTFANGMEVREWLVSADDRERAARLRNHRQPALSALFCVGAGVRRW